MVEYTTDELFGNSSAPGFSGAEVFGNSAQTLPVPSSLSSAEVFATTQAPPPANASASPPLIQPQGMTSAEVYGQSQQASDPTKHFSATRGLVSGFMQDYPQLAGETLEGLSHFAPEHFKSSLRSGADYLRGVGSSAPAGYERIAPNLKDVKGLDDALTWAGETFGQGAASTAAPIALGAAGFAAGTPFGPVGQGVGAVSGGVLGGSFQNYGEVYKDLKTAGVEPERAAKLSAMVLPIMSALDVVGLTPGAKLITGGIKEAAKGGLIKLIAKEAGKSALSEGVTEGAQEAVKQGTISAETGKPFLTTENAWNILENALGGALVGGPFGAGSAAIAEKGGTKADNKRTPTPEEVTEAFKEYKPGAEFSDLQLEVLRRMTGNQAALTPEGGNFEPSVQSAMMPTTDSVAPTERYGPGPLWYSKAEEAAQSLPESGTADQMRGTLLNKGIRHDELTWTGLDEFFHERGANIQATTASVQETPAVSRLAEWKQENLNQKPPQELIQAASEERAAIQKAKGEATRAQANAPRVTKQDILNHLRENRYTLKEQIRDDLTSPITPQEQALQQEQTTLGERLDQLNEVLDDESNPINRSENWTQRQPILDEWHTTYARLNEVSRTLQTNNVTRPSVEYSGYVTPGERRGYATLSIQVPENERAGDMMLETPNRYSEEEIKRARGYRQPHFTGEEYRNTIAFTTVTIREGTDGRMTINIEQIQADWAQLARTQGYITKELIAQEIAALKLQDETYNAFVAAVPLTKGLYVSSFDSQLRMTLDHANLAGAQPTLTVLDRIKDKYGQAAHDVALAYADAYYKRLQVSRKIDKAVADAPYKMTQDWTRLMLRRVLRWAADKGIQRVTWNNPELAYQYPTGSAGAAQMDVSKMSSEERRRWEGIKKHYGQTIPSVAKELARQYGGDIGITQIKTSQVGPWVARPFVANGVVTGWGMGRWEGSNENWVPTQSFNDYLRYSGGATKSTFSTQHEAQQTIDQLKTTGYVMDAQVTKFSNQVMYLDFDRRAQWNFQTKGFPSFMLDPGIAPNETVDPSGQFTIHEDQNLRLPMYQTPMTQAAYKFAGALKEIAKKFGFDSRLDIVLLAKPIGTIGAVKTPMASHQMLNGRHYIQVDMNFFNTKLSQLADSTRIPLLWSTMMHEFGHAVMSEHFSSLPTHVRMAIRGAYESYLASSAGIQKLGERMARRMSAMQIITSGDGWAMKDWNALTQGEREYWAHFDEWFADQVARWATTAERPLSIVDKVFAGINQLLTKVFRLVSEKFGLNFKPEIVMEDWLNSFMDSEGDFGHTQYLALDAQHVKTDQRAISAEEPDMFVPPRSPEADTIKQSAAAVTTAPGVASSAVHASRFNWMYKYMGGLAQLAEANPFFEPLLRYVERIRGMHLDETRIHDAAVRIRKDWRALGNEQADNLTSFINDLVNLDFLTPAEKTAGVIRQPTPAEQGTLVTKHSLSAAGLKVFQKIKILNDWTLDLTAQTAKKSAMRVFSTAAAAPTLMSKIVEIDTKVAAIKSRPFFPFMRFGRHYVIQKDAAGNTVHFETFERLGLKSAEKQQLQRADDLRKQFPGYPEPEIGVLPEAASPFVGLPPMLLEEIRNKLTLTPSQNDALDNLMYNHSTATKFPRAFKQNYTKGYSMDFQRSFARYFFYAGKYYARAEHSWELNDDIRAARLVGGNTATQIANFMSDHLKNTVLEAKGDYGILKGGIFLWAMGYVPAAATQNLTQTPMITFPYLAGKFGDIKATRAITKAMSQMSSFYRRGAYEKTGVREMEAFDYGIKNGILTESQASELAAASQSMNLLRGIGGNTVQRNWQAFMEKSAWMFEMAEQWNRRIAYRAGYNLALENPNAAIVKEATDAYKGEFNKLASRYGDRQYAAAIITASYVTTKTQYEYARPFRARFMRGRLPGTLFVFKTYMANTLWMLANNKSDVLPRFLVVSALMGGLAGIPGYEDLRDILKALGHWMNKDFNVEHALRDFVNSHFDGKIPPDMIIGGMARRGYGIPALLDLLGSFATGTPGRGFDGKQQGQNVPFPVLDRHRAITLGPLLPVELGKLFDPTDDVNRTIAEQSQRASGAVFSVGFNLYKAIMDNKLAATDPKRWERAIPRELGDLTRTWRAFSEGRERSRGGVNSAPTIADFNWRDSEQAAEMVAMAAGYNPLRVQAKWDSIMAKAEVEKFYEMQQKTLFGQLFEARKAANPGEVESVLESIRRFNRELPPIARGYTITQDNATKSIQGRERELIARERGIPTQKRNIPISQYVDTLFPETTVDVRRVR